MAADTKEKEPILRVEHLVKNFGTHEVLKDLDFVVNKGNDRYYIQSALSIADPAIAIVAPTEISCPPDAAVTNVIPIARIASSEP